VLITYLCYLRSSNDNTLIFLYKFLHHSWLKRCNEHILPWKPHLEIILDVLDCNCTNESAMFSYVFYKQPSIALLFFYYAIHVTWHLLMFFHLFFAPIDVTWPFAAVGLCFLPASESICLLVLAVNEWLCPSQRHYLRPCCPSRIVRRGCFFCASKKRD